MAKPIEVKFDGAALKAKLIALGQDAIPTAARSLFQSGGNIMQISKDQYCPVETGTLRGTGIVYEPDIRGRRVSVTLGYGGPSAPYAIKVHENPRAGRTGGVSPTGKPYKRWAKVGEWKYLETPFKQNTGNVRSKLIQDLDHAFAKYRKR